MMKPIESITDTLEKVSEKHTSHYFNGEETFKFLLENGTLITIIKNDCPDIEEIENTFNIKCDDEGNIIKEVE